MVFNCSIKITPKNETLYNDSEHQASSYPKSTLKLTSFVCRGKMVAAKFATRDKKALTADK